MNLLITGAWNHADRYMPDLEKQGHRIVFLQHEKNMLPCSYEWPEGVICNGLFLSHTIEKFTNLKYIQLTSAGMDRIPLDYIKEKGIIVHNAKGVYSIPMAEFAVSGVLQIYKQAAYFHENQKSHRWVKHRGLMEVYGKTVCMIGCGSVGTECAKRFKAFGCNVVGIDLVPREDDNYSKIVSLGQMDAILPEVDILVLTLPLTEETRHLMNEQRIALLKEGAVLANIARGSIIDTEALTAALNRLRGAVLDVFEEEPLDETCPLWDMGNVILTPHNSFVGDGNDRRLAMLIFENLRNSFM